MARISLATDLVGLRAQSALCPRVSVVKKHPNYSAEQKNYRSVR